MPAVEKRVVLSFIFDDGNENLSTQKFSKIQECMGNTIKTIVDPQNDHSVTLNQKKERGKEIFEIILHPQKAVEMGKDNLSFLCVETIKETGLLFKSCYLSQKIKRS